MIVVDHLPFMTAPHLPHLLLGMTIPHHLLIVAHPPLMTVVVRLLPMIVVVRLLPMILAHPLVLHLGIQDHLLVAAVEIRVGKTKTSKSKFLSLVLRHDPSKAGITLDTQSGKKKLIKFSLFDCSIRRDKNTG